MAAMSQLDGNSRLGLRTSEYTLHPGFTATQSSTALRDSWTVASETYRMSLSCGFGGPSFHGTLKPRPAGTGNAQWDGNFGESLGISTKIPMGSWGIAQALGLPDAGCEFGACGGGISGFQNGYTYNPKQSPWASPTLWQSLGELLAGIDWSDPNGRLFGTHYCGPGGVAIRPEHWTKPAKPTTSAMTNMASLREITGIQSMPLTERAAFFEPVIKPFVMLPPASRVGRPIP